jgi:hypothetical protein
MLTYFGCNVTKNPSFTKYSNISSPTALRKSLKTPDLGYIQSEFSRRAIVDRHSTKHTGLNRPRKTKGRTAGSGTGRSGDNAMGVSFDKIDGVIWYDGKLVPWADANVHVLTHGLHYGSSVFEGERAYGGEIFKGTAHSERLKKSAEMLDFEIPYSVAEIDAAKKLVCRLKATPFISQSPAGAGRAISAPPSASRASASVWPTIAGPTQRRSRQWPRPPACT